MTNELFTLLASNLCVGGAIALLAWGVQRTGRAPRLAHALWLLVLVKLATPPFIDVPVFARTGPPPVDMSTVEIPVPAGIVLPAVDAALPTASVEMSPPPTVDPLSLGSILFALWIAGALFMLTVSLRRIVTFERELTRASTPAPLRVRALADEMARRLGLKRTPIVVTTTARISPLVWWVGGPPRIVLPRELAEATPDADLRAIVAHEIAHVARGDHWVRGLECFLGIVLWWNPLAWWARRNLRVNEEICCDALVLSALDSDPHRYAGSLLSVAEFLAVPAFRPPPLANTLHSGGSLERRFKMILSPERSRPLPRAIALVAVAVALAVLPIGLTTWSETGEGESELMKSFAALGVREGAVERVAGYLESEGFTEQQIELSFEALLEMIPNVHFEHENFAMSALVESYLTRFANLDEAQLDMIESLAKRLARAGKREHDEHGEHEAIRMERRIRHHLREQGFTERQTDGYVEVAHKLTKKVTKSGENFELNEAWLEYFEGELDLTEKQVDIVIEITRRIAHHELTKRDDWKGILERVSPVLQENGFDEKQLKGALGVIEKMAYSVRKKEKVDEDAWLAHLEKELELNEDQARLLMGLAKRVAKHMAARAHEEHHGHDEHPGHDHDEHHDHEHEHHEHDGDKGHRDF